MNTKEDLNRLSARHTERLLADLRDVIEIPKICEDRIRREIGYATKDGARAALRADRMDGNR